MQKEETEGNSFTANKKPHTTLIFTATRRGGCWYVRWLTPNRVSVSGIFMQEFPTILNLISNTDAPWHLSPEYSQK